MHHLHINKVSYLQCPNVQVSKHALAELSAAFIRGTVTQLTSVSRTRGITADIKHFAVK